LRRKRKIKTRRPKMEEKIIVPLDGSKVGEAALPYVEDLVSKLSPEVKAEVTLLQVLSKMTHYVTGGEATVDVPYTSEETTQITERAMTYLNETGERLRYKGAMVKSKVVVGDASEEIVKAAEEIDANLIAMSTHGRSGITRWAFGSVTDKVLRREGRIPIAMVRAPR
jgi:nucleotide-binding universal stress UspA family protein